MPARHHHNLTLVRPLLVWDGDCGFCKKCIAIWRRWTNTRVDDCPYQECKLHSSQVTNEQFAQRVYLFEPNGHLHSGAAAVFRSLIKTRLSFLDRWYSKSNLFACSSERAYNFVATHRYLFSKLFAPILPNDHPPKTSALRKPKR